LTVFSKGSSFSADSKISSSTFIWNSSSLFRSVQLEYIFLF